MKLTSLRTTGTAAWLACGMISITALGHAERNSGGSSGGIAGDNSWDIATDFSNVQGQDDWHYGSIQGGFIEMTEYNAYPVAWTVDWGGAPPSYWTLIRKDEMHPNGGMENGGKTLSEQAACLRWVSPIAATVHVVTTAKKADLTAGNGVTWTLSHNGTPVQTAGIAFNDSVGVTFEHDIAVNVGDTIDFILGSNAGDATFDGSLYTAKITVAGASAADIDGDGAVNGADLGLLLSAWGPCGKCPADVNGDGVVDGVDLGLLLAEWTD
jgi:hypothetical protein